ncbi:uncharacterized protein LOC133832403 [Humulus lupulus]|uniref:uncharacterized protein LOC133832403 n=1 Tax=Humulus lupulus TaxID=3486 RepID=UPI002B415206|nr:uncharacterized protein LOC133832403 [Humulus lupulus]
MMTSYFSGWDYYTRPASEGRILLIWQGLSVSVEVLKETTPWLVAGDFNAVFEVTNRVGGHNITALELVDAQKWRALGLVDEMRTRDWLDLFPHAEAVVNWEMLSDHCFCIIKSGAALNCGVKPFIFFNMWTDHDNFKETVMQSWCKPSKGYGLERIIRKLGRLKHVLRKFNKRTVGDVVQNYTIAKENYQAAQINLQGDPHSTDLQREERLAGEIFSNHARIYDNFLRQKSKVNWLRYGDDNTTYFHACLKQRRASNRITSFVNETGQLIERFEDVVAHFVNHFRKIMGSQSNASVPIQRSCFRYGNSLSLDQQICLIKPFTKKEVEDALFSISPIKSPGPDGYGSGFFKVMWKDVGAEISKAILDLFDRGLLPEEFNKATISLIPKIETPT